MNREFGQDFMYIAKGSEGKIKGQITLWDSHALKQKEVLVDTESVGAEKLW